MTSMHASFSKDLATGNLNSELIRHLVLNMIRANNVRFRAKYGSIVLACDSPRSWRKKAFTHYKAHRKTDRSKQTHIDWTQVFPLFDSIKQELCEFTHYPVLEVEGAEGDDVIAALAIRYQNETNIIVSADRDFCQLQAYTSVVQYDPIRNRMIHVDNPLVYLYEHIINGDRNDGVPNILSDDDAFVNPVKRQGKVTQKRMEAWKAQPVSTWENQTQIRNWSRNKNLIDLRSTPPTIVEAIINQFEDQRDKGEHRIFEYIKKYKLSGLLDCMSDF